MKWNTRIRNILAGLFLAVALGAQSVAQTSNLTDTETLAKAEERAEALRTELFDLKTREIELQAHIDDLNYRLTPRAIQQALAFVGSVRPMDEHRDALRARLEGEKLRATQMLEQLAARRERLEVTIREADASIERLRRRLK
jgi:cell division protein FtsB